MSIEERVHKLEVALSSIESKLFVENKKDSSKEYKSSDFYHIAREFWKNDSGIGDEGAGQVTGLLSRFCVYIINNMEEIENAVNKKN